MVKLKITPINIEKAKDVKGISKNISAVVDFQIATANDINRVISELNKILPMFSKGFDDTDIKNNILSTQEELEKIKSSISHYDDTGIKKAIYRIESSTPTAYDDSVLIEKIELLSAAMIDLSADNDSLRCELNQFKASTASIQKEIRSNRKEAGYKIDVIEQKLNVLTEIK